MDAGNNGKGIKPRSSGFGANAASASVSQP